jgi:hypothetical protein
MTMRARFVLAALLCAACATPEVGRPGADADLAISLSRDASSGRPALVVTLTNRSQRQICIRADVLRNPNSGDLDLSMRDATGRAVRYRQNPGFIPPPLMETVRVDPGGTTHAQAYLDDRFELGPGGMPFPQGMSAQASIPYGYCEETFSLRATSAWQPI